MGIFARVLQEILVEHQNDDYGHLRGQAPKSDPIWYPLRRLAIAPEVISRLKQAAASDERRATLNPSDLDYLIEQLHLKPEEQTRLRAALLAQGVEIFLQDRMAPGEQDTVIEITEFIYHNLLKQSGDILAKTRDIDEFDVSDRDAALEQALALADRVDMLVIAAEEAKARYASAEASFWRQLAITGYQQVIRLILPVEPALAAEFEKKLARL